MERMTIRPITGHLRTEKSHFLTSFGSPCKVKKTLGTIVCDGIMMMNTSDHNERASSPITSLASVLIAGKHKKEREKGERYLQPDFNTVWPPLALITAATRRGIPSISASMKSAGTRAHISSNHSHRTSKLEGYRPLWSTPSLSQSHRCSMGLRSGL